MPDHATSVHMTVDPGYVRTDFWMYDDDQPPKKATHKSKENCQTQKKPRKSKIDWLTKNQEEHSCAHRHADKDKDQETPTDQALQTEVEYWNDELAPRSRWRER